MGRQIAGLLIVTFTSIPAWAQQEHSGPPPRPLQRVGDHWTPYSPPTQFPPEAQVYIIQPGDTLWDLAQRFLGNPYLWPQLWEKNQYIRDAHWIYPGDPLMVGLKAVEGPGPAAPAPEAPQPQVSAQGEVAGLGEEGAGLGLEGVGGAEGELGELVPLGSEDDIHCFAYLDVGEEKLSWKISGAERAGDQFGLSSGDIVYLNAGEAEGVKAGDEFFVVVEGKVLRHPATGAKLGRVMHYLGHLRVLCVQEHTATAEIMAACDAIPVGSSLKPFEPIPIPMGAKTPMPDRCEPGSGKARGFVIYAKDDVLSLGADHVVMVDLGEADELAPGSFVVFYRDNAVPGLPRIVLGQGAALTAGPHWATVKIVQSKEPIFVGDRVEVQ